MEYSGIYGKGYKDNEGNLYLELNEGEILVREITENNKYNVGILVRQDDFNLPLAVSIDEDLSLREWRNLFLELHTKKGIHKLERLICDTLDPLRQGMLPWETAYMSIKKDGSFEVEFPIPIPIEELKEIEMNPEFNIF